jgi:hypothetical protein
MTQSEGDGGLGHRSVTGRDTSTPSRPAALQLAVASLVGDHGELGPDAQSGVRELGDLDFRPVSDD